MVKEQEAERGKEDRWSYLPPRDSYSPREMFFLLSPRAEHYEESHVSDLFLYQKACPRPRKLIPAAKISSGGRRKEVMPMYTRTVAGDIDDLIFSEDFKIHSTKRS